MNTCISTHIYIFTFGHVSTAGIFIYIYQYVYRWIHMYMCLYVCKYTYVEDLGVEIDVETDAGIRACTCFTRRASP